MPTSAIDDFLGEFHCLTCFASVPLSCDLMRDIIHQRHVFVEEPVIRETVDAIFFFLAIQCKDPYKKVALKVSK